MAFSRTAIYGEQKGKSIVNVPIIVTASFCSVAMARSLDQTDHQVVYSSQYPSSCANCHPGSVFTESDIAAIVEASFDKPMLASRLKHLSGRSLAVGKTGNAVLNLATGFEDLSLAYPVKLTLQAIHLPNTRPIKVVIEHGAGLNRAFFKPSMPIIDFDH